MGTLKEDIKSQAAWIVKAFGSDGFKLDYSIESVAEIDRFFARNMKKGQPKSGGRLANKGYGTILFSMGAYVGETIIKNVDGAVWITDDDDPQGELTVSLKLPDGTETFPVQKVMKRFENGSEDAVYPYVHAVVKDFKNVSFRDDFWQMAAETDDARNKPWWKFWQK